MVFLWIISLTYLSQIKYTQVQKHPTIFCLVVVLTTFLFVWNAAQGNIALDETTDSLASAIGSLSWKM
jgi:hypothetical protein